MLSKKKSLARIAQMRGRKLIQKNEEESDVDQQPEEDKKTESEKDLKDDSSQNDEIIKSMNSKERSSPINNLSDDPISSTKKYPRNKPIRNQSLKYSSGSLHGELLQPQSFDHDYLLPSEQLDLSDKDPRVASMPTSRNSSPPPLLRRPCSRTHSLQSPRKSPSVLLQDEHGVIQTADSSVTVATSPLKLPQRSSSMRYGSPRLRRSKNSVRNPIYHSSPPSRNESEESSEEEHNVTYGTPPQRDSSNFLQIKDNINQVSKSNSVASLAPDASFARNLSLSMSQARNRPFLYGSVGETSLLGNTELEKCFPDRKLRLFVGTWNMNEKNPPRHITDFLLPNHVELVPDILVVGTQETFPDRTEWEIRLQDTLGPSHVLFHSCYMGTLHQGIFLRRDLIWYCTIPETDSFNARPGTQIRTKGAIATSFQLFGTSFLFVNSHLTAHQENSRDRIKDYRKICAMLNLPKLSSKAKLKEISDRFDCVFWSGDLNFRLEQTREIILKEMEGGTSVLDFDQLNDLRNQGLIFKGYHEADIHFPPTYKYDVGTNEFDTSSKQRIPSYTDRILFKHRKSTLLHTLHYESVQDVTTSDHKPVWGMWEVTIRRGKDGSMLAGGLFNRDIYLEGLKRRSEALTPILRTKYGSNPMCLLQ